MSYFIIGFGLGFAIASALYVVMYAIHENHYLTQNNPNEKM